MNPHGVINGAINHIQCNLHDVKTRLVKDPPPPPLYFFNCAFYKNKYQKNKLLHLSEIAKKGDGIFEIISQKILFYPITSVEINISTDIMQYVSSFLAV